jgi:hypothetical protein
MKPAKTPSQQIDARIKELKDWRGRTLSQVRALILKVDGKIIEEWKWDVPVWSFEGIICTGETYKDKVKLTFPKGSKLKDPRKVFNSGHAGVRRVLDIFEGDAIDVKGLQDLIRSAMALNSQTRKSK